MLTALFIQHDQGFHAHLVTLQHNNDVTIARQTYALSRRSGARAAVGAARAPRDLALNTTQTKLKQTNGKWDDRRGDDQIKYQLSKWAVP